MPLKYLETSSENRHAAGESAQIGPWRHISIAHRGHGCHRPIEAWHSVGGRESNAKQSKAFKAKLSNANAMLFYSR